MAESEKSGVALAGKKYGALKNTVFCLKCTAECYPRLLLWCLCAVAVNVALPVVTAFLPKEVIDAVTDGAGLSKLAAVTLGCMGAIAALDAVKMFLEKYIYQRRFRMNTYYLGKVAHKGLTTDYANQENERFRKLQAESFSFCNGHYSPVLRFYDVITALCSGLLGFTVYFVLLARLSPLVVCFLCVTTAAGYFVNRRVIGWTDAHSAEKLAYQQRTNYINAVSGELKSAKDIRLYKMTRWLSDVYDKNMAGLTGWYRRYTKKLFGVTAVNGLLSLLRDGAAYAYLLYLVLSGRTGVSDFVLYFGVVSGFSAWLTGILAQVNALGGISLSVDYLRAYLDFPERGEDKGRGGLKTGEMLVAPEKIELRNVSYRYPGADAPTLRGIDLTVNAGEHLAVVGLNGAGKTTLVKLICGLTDPSDGTVRYAGNDVRDFDRDEYYRLFSAVFQQFSLLPATVAEIVSETPAADGVDGEKVRLCLEKAGLWDKIASLPDGVKSSYGKTIHDDGVEFSGGEIQKLLLARALYKDAPVLVLDEPTAALDPIAESALYETYDEVTRGKTTVFISHRLASTRFCDRILLMENGEIIEEGTHESLLALGGKYRDMFETQAKYYRDAPSGAEGEAAV